MSYDCTGRRCPSSRNCWNMGSSDVSDNGEKLVIEMRGERERERENL